MAWLNSNVKSVFLDNKPLL